MQIELTERELEYEKDRKKNINMNLYKVLFGQKNYSSGGSIISLSENVPEYEKYRHITEDTLVQQKDLMELANEELTEKNKLLKKVLLYTNQPNRYVI